MNRCLSPEQSARPCGGGRLRPAHIASGVGALGPALHPLLSVSLGLWLGLALPACGGRQPTPTVFEPSSIAPAATGEVVARIDPNGNTRLRIDVRHLAPPDRVAAGAVVYVVWAGELDRAAGPHNLGALRVDPDLRGKLETVTPLRTFDLQITAEPAATVAAPTGPAALKVRIAPER
jgi:hypothetical protein